MFSTGGLHRGRGYAIIYPGRVSTITSTTTPKTTTSPRPLHLAIDGMSCGHCVAAVRDALAGLPGVTVQRVAVGSAAVTIEPGTTPPAAVVEAIRDAGYEARVDERTA